MQPINTPGCVWCYSSVGVRWRQDMSVAAIHYISILPCSHLCYSCADLARSSPANLPSWNNSNYPTPVTVQNPPPLPLHFHPSVLVITHSYTLPSVLIYLASSSQRSVLILHPPLCQFPSCTVALCCSSNKYTPLGISPFWHVHPSVLFLCTFCPPLLHNLCCSPSPCASFESRCCSGTRTHHSIYNTVCSSQTVFN